ncbi:hypothetical protein [Marinobacter sp. PE14]
MKSSEISQGYINEMQREEHFWKSWFEMYFWYFLDVNGYQPTNSRQGGSDSEIAWRGRKIQFENVSPTVGEDNHPHKVVHRRVISAPDLADGVQKTWNSTSDEESFRTQFELDLIIKRITTSFVAKASQLDRRVKRGKVSKGDHCVIVIDVSQIRKIEHFEIEEVGIKALYGLGQECFVWEEKGNSLQRKFELRPEILQPGKGSVQTNYFLGTKAFRDIAAVILCDANISDFALGVRPELFVFHNYHARNTLSKKLFREHQHYYPVSLGKKFSILSQRKRGA